MKIKLLRNIGISGNFHKIGDLVDVPRIFGLELIGSKRGEAVDGDGPKTGGVITTEDGLKPFPEGEKEPGPKASRRK